MLCHSTVYGVRVPVRHMTGLSVSKCLTFEDWGAGVYKLEVKNVSCISGLGFELGFKLWHLRFKL